MKKMIRVYIDGFKLYDLAKNKGSGVCALSKQLGCDPSYLGMHAREGWLPRSKYVAEQPDYMFDGRNEASRKFAKAVSEIKDGLPFI